MSALHARSHVAEMQNIARVNQLLLDLEAFSSHCLLKTTTRSSGSI
jgi:hypothetical protein